MADETIGHSPEQKKDAGKVPLELLPADALEEVARVLEFGASKYARGAWAKGIAFSRVLGAIMRHTFAILRGEDRDPETGRLHAAHLAAEALFLLAYQLRGVGSLDDRATLGQPAPAPPAPEFPTISGVRPVWKDIKLTFHVRPVPVPDDPEDCQACTTDDTPPATPEERADMTAALASIEVPAPPPLHEAPPKFVPAGAAWAWLELGGGRDRVAMYWDPDWRYSGRHGGVHVECDAAYPVDEGDTPENAIIGDCLARGDEDDARRIYDQIRAFANSCGAGWPIEAEPTATRPVYAYDGAPVAGD